tara:strand:- start:623 stop:859 length:237 start_codon:yes stop_codon:yes gene_type:complete
MMLNKKQKEYVEQSVDILFCIEALILNQNKVRDINSLIIKKKAIVASVFSDEQEKNDALNDLIEINNCFERWLKNDSG